MRRSALPAICSLVLVAQSPGPPTGAVQGVVFTAAAGGGRSVLPDMPVAIPAGSYMISAQAPE